ncbi:MAG: KTSC domain-containing protein [Firmicutes bacterium]|nr:KTSC domain-containing protein [Bacillota bacterium]
MAMQSVKSSNLAKVGYDAKHAVLKVQFTSGARYIYYDVPESVYRNLLNAESLGSYFYYNIRTSYRYEKVS